MKLHPENHQTRRQRGRRFGISGCRGLGGGSGRERNQRADLRRVQRLARTHGRQRNRIGIDRDREAAMMVNQCVTGSAAILRMAFATGSIDMVIRQIKSGGMF